MKKKKLDLDLEIRELSKTIMTGSYDDTPGRCEVYTPRGPVCTPSCRSQVHNR